MNYLLYIILGVAPSLIWLSFYLRKDAHPEPKKTILKIFFLGMGAAILAAIVEIVIRKLILIGFPETNNLRFMVQVLYISWGVALIEEFLKYLPVENKYLIVKDGVLREPAFDEPLDLMLYMVIAGLGFAALENILIFFLKSMPFWETLLISSLRFIGATFLHALCSGTFGFFLALSFLNHQKRFYFFFIGLTIAVLLHGTFNYSIIKIEESLAVINGSTVIENSNLFALSFAALIITLAGLALFVGWGFKRLKKIKSVCKIGNR